MCVDDARCPPAASCCPRCCTATATRSTPSPSPSPAAALLQVGPGIKLGEFDAACIKHGLATTAGTNPDTGIAGLTLNGGFGVAGRLHGLTIDNLLEVEVVLLDGSIVTANDAPDNAHRDLFWAVRGGGGNFGVVTRFRYRLYAQGRVLAHTAVHLRTTALGMLPGATAVARRWRDWSLTAPDDTTPFLVLPAGGPVVSFVPWVGPDLAAGRAYIAAHTNFGAAVVRKTEEMPYAAASPTSTEVALQSLFAKDQQPGNYYDTRWAQLQPSPS